MADHKFVETVHENVVLGVGAIAQLVKQEKKLFHSFTSNEGPKQYSQFHLLIMKNGAQVRLISSTSIKLLSRNLNAQNESLIRHPLDVFKLDGWYFDGLENGGVRIFSSANLLDLSTEEMDLLAKALLRWSLMVGTTNEFSWY